MKEKQLLKTIVEGIQEKKGKKITTVDLSKIESAATSHFIICEGQSTTQVMAIADSIREYVLQNTGIKPFGYDGYQNGQWIVIDYGSILAHIFLPEYRNYYKLEQLWNDAKLAEIPDVEYFLIHQQHIISSKYGKQQYVSIRT